MAFAMLEQSYEEAQFHWKLTDFFLMAYNTSLSPFHESPIFYFAGASWQMSLAKRQSRILDIYMSIEEGEGEYLTECKFGLRRGNGHILQLGTGRYLFTKDRIIRRTKHKGLRSSARIGYLFVKRVQARIDDWAPSGNLTIVVTIRRDNTHVPQISNKEEPKTLIKLNVLSDEFKYLMENKESCDTTLNVGNKQYTAHRSVLIARSPVFNAMFRHDTLEKRTGIIFICDCDPESFEEFLKYLYSGKMEEPSFVNALHLYETSEKYDVQELKSFCSTFMLENLTVENFSNFVVIADRYGESDPKLCFAAQNFFFKNSTKIISTVEWNNLLQYNGRLAHDLVTVNSKKRKYMDLI